MSSVASRIKSLSKQAREAINQKNYSLALEFADDILELDPENYNGCVGVRICVFFFFSQFN